MTKFKKKYNLLRIFPLVVTFGGYHYLAYWFWTNRPFTEGSFLKLAALLVILGTMFFWVLVAIFLFFFWIAICIDQAKLFFKGM